MVKSLAEEEETHKDRTNRQVSELQMEISILNNVRDGPLEKLWGGGEFSSRRNFFSLSNSLYEFFLGHSMNIFYG